MNYPRMGIRPTIDGRWGGSLREFLPAPERMRDIDGYSLPVLRNGDDES